MGWKVAATAELASSHAKVTYEAYLESSADSDGAQRVQTSFAGQLVNWLLTAGPARQWPDRREYRGPVCFYIQR